jgi:hypothetical protein
MDIGTVKNILMWIIYALLFRADYLRFGINPLHAHTSR